MSDHIGGKVVVVTGAASGFGRLLAEALAGRGAHVVGGDVDDDGLRELADAVTGSGGSIAVLRTDVTARADVQALVALAVDRFGAVDVLVNNAGTMPLGFFADHARAADAWDRCIDVNLRGVLNGIVAVHDQMIGQGRGHVVNLSSIYGNVAVVGSAVYSATKAAVNVLSESLRAESQGRIKVTVVKPTGVPGTNLGSSIVNGDAMVGLLGQNAADFGAKAAVVFGEEGTPERAALTDPDDIRYWAISPQDLVDQIVYVIDQPWGVSISDITVRASGDQYLF